MPMVQRNVRGMVADLHHYGADVRAGRCSPAMTDFIFMVKDPAPIFCLGQMVKTVTNEVARTGRRDCRAYKTSVADLAFENDIETTVATRNSLIICRCQRACPSDQLDPFDREEPASVPDNANQPYDMHGAARYWMKAISLKSNQYAGNIL
jgi:propionyl-CoA carboxylase beta chain